MPDVTNLQDFLETAWQTLRTGIADGKSPARYPTFATVSPNGLPEARTVALRRASRSEALVEVHTDIVTPKMKSLHAFPHAALHVWVPRSDLQIRLTTTVTILTGADVDTQWGQVPPASRVSYGTKPDPGLPIAGAFDYEKPPVRDRFAVLRCAVDHIDLVHLGEQHRRAEYSRHNNWQGTWLSP
ncbi:MAG: pyridoxamine 5'-phosphate oxidase family protein [Planktomarina sp.]